MLTKLKCFFGWHEWMYTDQDGLHGMRHRQVLRKRKCKCCPKKQKEGLRGKFGSYPYWINYNSVQVDFRCKSVPDKPTPPPERPSSRLPQINVDVPMPECKEPRKKWQDSADECDRIAKKIIDLLESTQETKKMANDLKIKVQPANELSEEDKAARVAPTVNIFSVLDDYETIGKPYHEYINDAVNKSASIALEKLYDPEYKTQTFMGLQLDERLSSRALMAVIQELSKMRDYEDKLRGGKDVNK